MAAGAAYADTGASDYDDAPITRPRTGALPEAAAEIYRALCNEAEDASDLAHASHLSSFQNREEVVRLTAEIDHFNRQPNPNRNDRGYRALLGQRERARRDRDVGQRRSDQKSARNSRLTALRNQIDAWLGANYDRIIVPHAHPAPKLGKGETPADAVTRCRQAAQDLRRERAVTDAAPVPSAEAKAAARAFVAETAALARPDVSQLLTGRGAVTYPALAELPVLPLMNADYGMVAPGARVRDGLALACWLMLDTVIAALDREVDANADDKRAMTREARATRLAEIDAQILTAERDEVAFVEMAEGQGANLDHRPDVDPRALLRVTLAEAA